MPFEPASKMEARFHAGIEQGDLQLGMMEIGMKLEAVFGQRDKKGQLGACRQNSWDWQFAEESGIKECH